MRLDRRSTSAGLATKKGTKLICRAVDFVKIQNATLQDLGYVYGPACVQFNCAIDLHLKGTEIETIAQ